MTISKGFTDTLPWLLTLTVVILEIIYLHGFLTSLKIVIPWIAFSFFITDVQIAMAHFEIDNFKPEDNGYKHHLVVAKYGFKYEKLIKNSDEKQNGLSGLNEKMNSSSSTVDGNNACGPCRPCQPCSPTKKNPCSPFSPKCINKQKNEESDLNEKMNSSSSTVDGNNACGPCRPCRPCSPTCKNPFSSFLPKFFNKQTNEESDLNEKMDSYSSIVDVNNVCAPFCHPCVPCGPTKRNLITTKDNSNLIKYTMLSCIIQLLCYYLEFNFGLGLILPIFHILNTISGSGAPDYYAHHAEKAPKYVKFMQKHGLLMTPNQHEKHHINPRIGYAYFCPLTNMVLDNTPFWNIVTPIMEWKNNMKAVPVPVPAFDE
jgi:hypothetical protein